jgi:SAM-dependent methyltransferase
MPEPVGLFSGDATEMARMYERMMVPGVFMPWGRELVARVGVTSGQRALDVGCGTGAVSVTLSEAVGASGSVEGIDLAPGMLARAQERGLPNATFQVADATTLPFEDESFDVGVSQHAIQFVPDWRAAVGELHRTLRPGGRVGIACWTAGTDQTWFGPLIDVVNGLGWTDVAGALKMPFSMDPDALGEAMASAGFRDVDVQRVERDVELPETFADETLQVPPYNTRFSTLSPDEQARAVEQVRAGMAPFKVEGGYRSRSVATIATAAR